MKDKVLEFCRRERLFRPGERVVCALSGGADSVAMTHCLLSLAEELQIEVTAAHYNHCLRGEASEADEAFVRRLCASWGLELVCGRGDVAENAARTGRSIEEAARHLRYDFLLSQPGVVAVAHNADDQVETVLLNVLRGTGLRGLAAMQPRQERVVRPVLTVTRGEIEAYLQAEHLPHREDHTNGEDEALRNRLRHHVIPLLQAENPSLSATVARMTGLLRQDEAYLEEQTRQLLELAKRPGGWDCRILQTAPPVLRSRAVRQLLTIPKPSMAHVRAVEKLLEDTDGSASADLSGGFRAVREYGLLRLERADTPPAWELLELHPGETGYIPALNLEVSMNGPVILEKKPDSRYTFAVKYDMMKANPVVWIRPRKQGDTLHLPGGTRTVKRLMIDRKIPASQRGLLPVVETENGVAAVFGLDADCLQAANPGEAVWIIQFKEER